MLDGYTIAVILAACVNIVLGGVWYHPKVLGTLWADAHGFKVIDLKASGLNYFGAFVVGLVMSWMLGTLFSTFEVTTLSGKMGVSFFVWLGFIATTHFSGVIWAKKTLESYFIDAGFFLVSLEAMAIVFAIFM